MCDSVVASASETASGITLFGKNSDRGAQECQPFVQLPEAHHPPRATLRCTHLEIPQVAETYRVMGHSPWWVWGFEHGVNEHGVAIGNHSVFSNEPLDAKPGLIGMDLVRLGLERGRDAREALEVIATLVESYGQGGAALGAEPDAAGYTNSFLLADPGEAWLLETSNRRWAARRVALAAASNHLSLGVDWEIGSRDLESFARSRGWWRGGGRLDFAAAYRDVRLPGWASEGRRRRALEWLEAGRGRHDVRGFARLLRDHGDGGAAWRPGAAPDQERFDTLCSHGAFWTTASLIAPLPESRPGPWPVWICFGTPCTGIFLPVYLDGVLPERLARGGEHPDADSAWWIFKRLQDAVAADPQRLTPQLREGWLELEEKIEAERGEVEGSARSSAIAGDADGAAEIVSDFMARSVEAAVERAASLGAGLS